MISYWHHCCYVANRVNTIFVPVPRVTVIVRNDAAIYGCVSLYAELGKTELGFSIACCVLTIITVFIYLEEVVHLHTHLSHWKPKRKALVLLAIYPVSIQRTHDAKITSLWRQNDVIMTLLLRRVPVGYPLKWPLCVVTQRTQDVKTMPLFRQNDVATSFWRNSDVVLLQVSTGATLNDGVRELGQHWSR